MMLSERKGFTLIELLIVIIIIGVLATLALPQYTGFVEKGRAAEALTMIGALKTGEAAFKLDAGKYTDTLASLGISNAYDNDASATAVGQYWYYGLSGAETSRYIITANRSSHKVPSDDVKAQTIILTWSDTAGASWSGTHTGAPKQ